MVRIFNPGATPVQTTLEGHTLGGREWAAVEPDTLTDEHVAAGRLVVVELLPAEAAALEVKPSKNAKES